MKKFFALFFILVLFVTAVPCGAAYKFSAERYSIDLPDDFDFAAEDRFIGDNGDTLTVTIEKNTEKFCIADLSEEDMKKYAENLAEEGTQGFTSIGMEGKVEVVSYRKIENVNGKTVLETVLKTSAKTEDGEAIHLQKLCEFAGVKNKYTFIYTANEEKDIDAFDESFKTIVIEEEQIESKKDKLVTIGMCAGVVLLILVGVVKFVIRTPYRKGKNKK